MERIHRIQSNESDLALSPTQDFISGLEEEREEDFFEKELDRLWKGRQVDKWSTRPISQDGVNDLKNMGRLKSQDRFMGHHTILPRGRTAMHLLRCQ